MNSHEICLECVLSMELNRKIEKMRAEKFQDMSLEAFIDYLLKKGLQSVEAQTENLPICESEN